MTVSLRYNHICQNETTSGFLDHVEFWGKKSPVKVGVGTVEKLTLENMCIFVRIITVGGAEPEIRLGVICLPQLQKYTLPHQG